METPDMLVGLRLHGLRCVVVGGTSRAQRQIPALIAIGAEVVVVASGVTPAIEGLVLGGELTWVVRDFVEADLDDAWYVVAASDDAALNERVATAALARRVFCAGDNPRATASTPATGAAAGLSVAVLGSATSPDAEVVRDQIVWGLDERALGAVGAHERGAGTGGVTLIGGGPGSPDLITVAGRRALMGADVVVADRLAPRELLSQLASTVELVDVAKLPRGRSAQQEEINRIIVDRALAGLRVARFKGGDSFVFGRGFEEVIACRAAGVPVTVVPGLTSPMAVPGIAGIPVTHRHVAHEFTVVSGHLAPGHPESLVDWGALARLRGTLILMMAVQHAPQIAEALLGGGRSPETPVAFVCDGTMPTERTVLSTLASVGADIVAHQVRAPAIIVVGEVVAVAHPERFSQPDRAGSSVSTQSPQRPAPSTR